MRRRPDYARPPRRSVRGNTSISPRHWWRTIGVTAAVLLALNGAFALAHWTIAAIEVRGTKLISTDQIVALVERQLSQKRFFVLPQQVSAFFSTRGLRRMLTEEFPFANWTVDKRISGVVSVTARERRPALVWSAGKTLWYLDRAGEAFAAAPTAKASGSKSTVVIRHPSLAEGLPVVRDESGGKINLGGHPISAPSLAFILDVAERLSSERGANTPEVTGYRYDGPRYQLTVETGGDYEILFAVNQPVEDQLEKLQVAIAQGITRRPDLRYLDVRFGQKVFYR